MLARFPPIGGQIQCCHDEQLYLPLQSSITLLILIHVSRIISAAAELMTWENPVLLPPANGGTSPVGATVSIEFSEMISPATVTSRTFSVMGSQSGHLTGTYVVSDGHILFDPATTLHAGEWLQASLTTDIANMAGGSPSQPTVWNLLVGPRFGPEEFFNRVELINNGAVWSIQLGDLDEDADIDVLIGTVGGNRAAFNNGNDIYSYNGLGLFGLTGTTENVLGDVDGDGDLDFLNIHFGFSPQSDVWIFLNDGSGVFAQGDTLPYTGWPFRSAALGDLDGDGDLDAFIGGTQRNTVWLNDGNGNFTDSGQALGSSDTWEVELGDLDNDGDLDAFGANVNNLPNETWLNDGSGTFSLGQQLGASHSNAVALGDFNRDGFLDAFVGNSFSTPVDRIWLNDGTGTLVDSGLMLGSDDTFDAAIGDYRGDGTLDIFTTEQGGTLWQHNVLSPMVFTELKPFGQSNEFFNAIAVSDWYGRDLYLDAVMGWATARMYALVEPIPCQQTCTCVVECIVTCTDFEITTTPQRLFGGWDLQAFYDLRDEVMVNTPEGQRLIDLYESHNDEIYSLLLADTSLWDEAAAVLRLWQPNVQALISGQGATTTITAEQVQAVEDFIDNLSAAASPTLQQLIAAELAAQPPPDSFIDMTVDQASQQLLSGNTVFLPVVNR